MNIQTIFISANGSHSAAWEATHSFNPGQTQETRSQRPTSPGRDIMNDSVRKRIHTAAKCKGLNIFTWAIVMGSGFCGLPACKRIIPKAQIWKFHFSKRAIKGLNILFANIGADRKLFVPVGFLNWPLLVGPGLGARHEESNGVGTFGHCCCQTQESDPDQPGQHSIPIM